MKMSLSIALASLRPVDRIGRSTCAAYRCVSQPEHPVSALLSARHALLALAIVAVWGTNFVVIRVGLNQFPPFLFAALRFSFAALPMIVFLSRPKVRLANLAAYGAITGAGQFGLLFLAMQGHISPGLASLVIQTQVFFTIGLSVYRTGERLRPYQLAALLLAVAGIVVIGAHADASATPTGLALVLLAAMSWASGNIIAREGRAHNMVAYVVWASLFSAPPLFVLSWLFEGRAAMASALVHADANGWACVLWQTVGNTLFGFAGWAWLLARYPAATVSPVALLVPVFGMATSAWWLGEALPPWKLLAACLVVGGLVVSIVYPRWRAAREA